jgi:hypothetical protein
MELTDHASRIARQDPSLERWFAEIRTLADAFEMKKLSARLVEELEIAAKSATTATS